MTNVIVEPGVCGLTADIKAEMVDRKARTAKITVDTQCKMIAKLVEGLGDTVSVFELLGMTRNSEPLLEKGRAGTRIHAACPVIAGIAKAAEAEAGLALPRDATIRFVQ